MIRTEELRVPQELLSDGPMSEARRNFTMPSDDQRWKATKSMRAHLSGAEQALLWRDFKELQNSGQRELVKSMYWAQNVFNSFRNSKLERDRTLAWDVLNRIEPGSLEFEQFARLTPRPHRGRPRRRNPDPDEKLLTQVEMHVRRGMSIRKATLKVAVSVELAGSAEETAEHRESIAERLRRKRRKYAN